jgi:hypothetical protein
VLPVATAATAAVLAAAALTWHSPSRLTLAAVVCLAVCVGLTVVERIRSEDWLNGATFLLVPVALGFGLRGLSLAWSGSHLTYPGWAPTPLRDQLAATALWVATAGALAVYIGYVAGGRLANHPPLVRGRDFDPVRVRWAVRVLVAVGVIGFAALVQRLGGASYFRDLAHARLDTAGLGIFKLASLGVRFALLLWLATTPNPSRRRLVLGCTVVLLLTTGQRSAVFATLIPVMIVYHNRVRRLPARTVGVVALCAVVLAVSLIVYRQYTRVTATPRPAAATSTRQQLSSGSDVFRSALVSLDGLVLVQQAVPADQRPNLGRSLLLVPEGYIPRSLWASKPPWRSNVLAARYLTAAHGGVFLSGFGTLWAIGLLPGVIVGSLILGAALGWAYARMRRFRSPAWVLAYAVIALGAARFMLAGDEVSLFFASQAIGAVVLVVLVVSRPRRHRLRAA